VLPGTYTVRLTANGQTHEQPLTVKMDPRVTTSNAELGRQHTLSMRLYALLREDFEALVEVQAFRADPANAAGDRQAAAIETTLRGLNGNIGSLYRIVEGADVGPTSQVADAAGEVERNLREALAQWETLARR
jgi:hypothetical protein